MPPAKNLTLVSVAVDGLTASELEAGWTVLKDEFKRRSWIINPAIVRDPERNRLIIMVAYELSQLNEVKQAALKDVRDTVEATVSHTGLLGFAVLEQPS
jgi:hypothetical protein